MHLQKSSNKSNPEEKRNMCWFIKPLMYHQRNWWLYSMRVINKKSGLRIRCVLMCIQMNHTMTICCTVSSSMYETTDSFRLLKIKNLFFVVMGHKQFQMFRTCNLHNMFDSIHRLIIVKSNLEADKIVNTVQKLTDGLFLDVFQMTH